MDEKDLERLRGLRTRENLSLNSSPYLSDTYTDEYGEVHDLTVRNYQKIGALNMCMVPRMALGDATGIGKTLQMLTAIGYVWLQEPEYVPIIVTKKSALYQWGDEVGKFMKNMQCVTVDGVPNRRQESYKDFFGGYSSMSKRLLIITYDAMLKDAQQSVVRDTSRKPNSKEKPVLAALKEEAKLSKKDYEEELKVFDGYFDQRSYEVWDYAKSLSAIGSGIDAKAVRPTTWCPNDEKRLQVSLWLRDAMIDAETGFATYKAKVCPTMVIPGILDYMNELVASRPKVKFMFVIDEAHTLKNHRGKMHGNAVEISKMCERVYGMTATPVKNRLMEFFAIFRVIVPSLFPQVTAFQNEFCITKLQSIGGGRKVPIIVGYRNLDEFVRRIEPVYLARQKHEVASELPTLITKELRCELTDEQENLYDLAEAGLLEKSEDTDAESATVLGAMVHVQEAVDHPELLSDEEGNPFEGESSKLQVLMEMLGEDLQDTKTIVFSRFRRMIDIIERKANEAGIKVVRVTGAEKKASQREKSKRLFQDMESGVNLILITAAGAESINLQAAEHFVMYDAPWSFGDYVQLVGRMIRIGSQHTTTVVTHLVGVRQDGSKTIDQYVIQTLRGKKKLADRVAGDGLKDGLVFSKNDAMEVADLIKSGRKKGQKKASAPKKVAKPATDKQAPKKAKQAPAPKPLPQEELEPVVKTPSIDFSDF